MLLNLPENNMSRTFSANWSTAPGHRCEPSASAKNDVEKPGMFMMRMPSSAKPRTTSSVKMRSVGDTGPSSWCTTPPSLENFLRRSLLLGDVVPSQAEVLQSSRKVPVRLLVPCPISDSGITAECRHLRMGLGD